MGKKNRVTKKASAKSRGLYINERTLKEAESEFKRKTKREWLEETEERLRLIYAVADRNAFLKNMYVTLMTNRDLFGHGAQRLKRAADHMIFEYECLDSEHVSYKDMVKLVKEETGIEIAFTDEELNMMLEYGFEHGVEGVREKFHELKGGGAADGDKSKRAAS